MESEVLKIYLPPSDPTMSSKSIKCGEVFVEDTLTLTLVCALCGKNFAEMEQFGAHIKCMHLSSENLEPLLLQIVKEEFAIEEDPFQDIINYANESGNASCDEMSEEIHHEQVRIKEPISDNSADASQVIVKSKVDLEQGKWTEFCSTCGLKFKNYDDFAIHMKLKHSYISNEEKALLEKEEASIMYVAHTCPMCSCIYKCRRGFTKHLQVKHHVNPNRIKEVLKEEFLSTRDCSKAGQTSAKGEHRMKGYDKLLLQRKRNAERLRKNVQKQKSEAMDPEPFVADDDSQAIKQSHENLTEFLTATKNMETANSMPEDTGIMDEMFQTEMASTNTNMINTEQTTKPQIDLKQEKWTEFCGTCGIKFKNNGDFGIHMKFKHSKLSNEEKALLEKEEASIIHVAHTCSICSCTYKRRCAFRRHLKLKHHLNPKRLKAVMKEEFWSTRDFSEAGQALDPEPFVADDDSQAIEQSLENLAEFLTATKNMETSNSMPEDNGIMDEMVETEMASTNKNMINTEQTSKPQIDLKQEKWTEFCSTCGLKFKNYDDLAIHMKLKHSYISDEEKELLEEEEASIIYVAHTCPMCSCIYKYRRRFKNHLQVKHHLNPKRIKEVLKEEFLSTRDCSKAGQALDPEPFVADDDSQAIEQSHENLAEFLTATKNMETSNSMPEDNGIMDEMVETEMATTNKNVINTEQTTKPQIDVKQKWAEFCRKCGIKFKNNEDFGIHMKFRHSKLSNEEKALLEEEEASIIHVAHTCPICSVTCKRRCAFRKHLKLKHHLNPKRIKEVLKEEFLSTRDCSKACQALDPEPFVADDDSQAIKQSHENLTEFLTAAKNMETSNSMPEDNGIMDEMVETEMATTNENMINAEQTTKQAASNIQPEMQSHNSINSNLWVAFCSLCGVKFRYKLGYEFHVQLKHSNCPAELKNELESKYSDVLVHVPIVCSICGLNFICKNLFADHLKLEHDMELGKIAALTLEERQNSRADNNQMLSIEQLLKPDLVKDVEAALRQCREKAESENKPFCAKCNLQFKQLRQYNRHMREKHNILTKRYRLQLKNDKYGPPYECKYCGKVFHMASRHKRHEAMHRGEKNYKCPHCPRAFTSKSNMNPHIRIHLNIKPYKCSYCDLRFVTSTSRKQHERSHTKERRFQCEECGNLYPKASVLRDHMFKHKNLQIYECDSCDKKFMSKKSQWEHSKTHRGDKFKCEQCERVFASKKSCKNHMLLHSDQKKYVCNICGKAFAQFSGLYSHRKSHKMSEA